MASRILRSSPWRRVTVVTQMSLWVNDCLPAISAVGYSRKSSSFVDPGPDLMEVEELGAPRRKNNDNYRNTSFSSRKKINDKYTKKWKQPEHNYGLEGKAKYPPSFSNIKPLGQFIFGLYPVLLAIKTGRRTIHTVYINEDKRDGEMRAQSNPIFNEILKLAEEKEIPVEWCVKSKMNNMSKQRMHQGVVADASLLNLLPCDSLISEDSNDDITKLPSLWLLLVSVQDPMNFGAVLRSAYYLGTEKAVTFNCSGLSPVVSKASAGAVEVMDIYETTDLTAFVSEQKAAGRHILGSVGNSTIDEKQEYGSKCTHLHNVVLSTDSLLLVGNEGEGLTEEMLDLCDQLITIPEWKHPSGANIDCLNVSVAAAIMQHQLLSSRTHKE